MSRPYNDSIPKDGSIVQGKVIRLEPAFCILQLLDFFRMRGLLHASEMDLNGAKIEESMSLDDVIYCRVLSVTSDEGPEGRPRQRIKLSTRGVDTMTGEESAASIANTQQQALSQNLNSTIGMGIALDPMANHSSLILKSQQSCASTLINGYALVGDTEGEPDLPPPVAEATLQPMGRGRGGSTMPAWMAKGGNGLGAPNEASVRPMGRGRGTTLPAWMTHGGDADQDEKDGNSRKHDKHRRKETKKHSRRKRHRDDDDDRDRRHSRKHHRRREERKSRHDSPHNSDGRDESSRDKRHRKKRSRHHGQSPSVGSDRDERGPSRDDNRETTRNDRKSRRHSPSYSDGSDRRDMYDRKRHHRKSRKRSYSDNSRSESRNNRGRPRSESQASSGGGSHYGQRHDENSKSNHAKTDAQFTSVAEAERLIAELENKERRR